MEFDVISFLWRNLFNRTSVISSSIQTVKNRTIFVKNIDLSSSYPFGTHITIVGLRENKQYKIKDLMFCSV